MVRAKFRCMEISQVWNGKSTAVRLLPVYAKTGKEWDEPDACEENRLFWEATPAGTALLQYRTVDLKEVPFVLGKTYYIDMGPTQVETRWKLHVTSQYEGQLDVTLEYPWSDEGELSNGSIEMSITNEAGWLSFQEAGPGSGWSVEFLDSSPGPG